MSDYGDQARALAERLDAIPKSGRGHFPLTLKDRADVSEAAALLRDLGAEVERLRAGLGDANDPLVPMSWLSRAEAERDEAKVRASVYEERYIATKSQRDEARRLLSDACQALREIARWNDNPFDRSSSRHGDVGVREFAAAVLAVVEPHAEEGE